MRKRKIQALRAADHVRRAGKANGPMPQTAARPLASMKDVYRAVADHPNAAQIQAALTCWAALKEPLEKIPAQARVVRRLLKKVDPTRDGIPHREWRPVKKLIGAALRHCGLEKMPARFEVPLTDVWTALLASVPDKPYRVAVERFARWCSMRGIAPTDVQPRDFDQFGDDLTKTARKDLACELPLPLRM